MLGSSVGGSQITGANLAKQYSNEIKILSCQPNEYSIEGEQWGGGRGAFSYHLIDALYGMADNNNDLIVNLQEAGRYIEDHVSAEVAPVSQVPMVLGNRTDALSKVDPNLLASIKSGKSNQMSFLSSIDTRGMEEDVLASVDTSVRLTYKLFKQALKDKVFLKPANACADSYYEQLIREPKLERLHSTLRRNYAAALQDDAQKFLNTILKTGLTFEILSDAKPSELYRKYPTYLERASQLIGKKHFMYSSLQARKFYFDGIIKLSDLEKRNSLYQALKWQPNMPHIYLAMISTYSVTQKDSAEYCAFKAIDLAPTWVMPYTELARFYLKSKMFENAEKMFDNAFKIDSNSVYVWYQKGIFYKKTGNFKKAEYWFLKAVSGSDNDICFPCAYINIGAVYVQMGQFSKAEKHILKALQLDSSNLAGLLGLGNLYSATRRFIEAEQQYKKAIHLDSTYAKAFYGLGVVYLYTQRYNDAEEQFKKSIQLDSNNLDAYNSLGGVYAYTQRYDDAEQQYKKAIHLDSSFVNAFYGLGGIYKYTQRYVEAEMNYKKAIQLDSNLAFVFYGLGDLYLINGRYFEAEQQFKKGIQLASNFALLYKGLGNVYVATTRYAEAELHFKKVIELDSFDANSRQLLGMVYFKTNRHDQAKQHFLKAISLNLNNSSAMVGMAYVLAVEGKIDGAIGYIEQAIAKGSTLEQLEKDEDLAQLRNTPEWKEFMKKSFPENIKD
jgi:tetratricopeptide (TPR) repeat protein